MITEKDIMRVFDEKANQKRNDFLATVPEIAKVVNYIEDKFPTTRISTSLRSIETVIEKDFVKTAYITIDEMCNDLNLDPYNINEYYYGASIDFFHNYWRVEFYRSGRCTPIYRKELVETEAVIGYKCT